MLLFSDGFDSYNVHDLGKKWGFVGWNGTDPQIVSGIDLTDGKPYATKNGRALYTGSSDIGLATTFKPSRTVFGGFALRTKGLLTMCIAYAPNQYMKRDGERAAPQYPGVWCAGNTRLLNGYGSVLTLTINQWNIGIKQTFLHDYTSQAPTQIGSINTTTNMWSGDYHYIQFGMTLNGNVAAAPTAWIEVRIGMREVNRFSATSILTNLPDGSASYDYFNALSLWIGGGAGSFWSGGSYGVRTSIDDFYLCNDEGDINNTFLGNVKVRRVIPTADGTENDAVPVGGTTGYRFQYVNEDFISLAEVLPYPEPTPEQNPLYLPWERGVNDYLALSSEGDRQIFRFGSVPFEGSEPKIYAAVLYALARGQYLNSPGITALKGVKKTEAEPIEDSNPTDTPLQYSAAALPTGGWCTYPMVFENNEVVAEGQPYQIWNPSMLNSSEFGIELTRCTIEPVMYDPNLTRFNIVFDQTVYEFLGFYDFTHRFYDAFADEEINLEESDLSYEYTWKFVESLYWDAEIVVTRDTQKLLNDTIEFSEAIPWTFLFTQSQIIFTDEIFIQWNDTVDDAFDSSDWAFGARTRVDTTGDWDELTLDTFGIAEDNLTISWLMALDEAFGLEEPYLWDNHELIEETIEINVTYVWDNHELIEEYLYPDDYVMQGIGLNIYEEMNIEEDHHDGNWVEVFPDYFATSDAVLTQQWRYEWYWGVCISSWQVSPIEQTGNDGDHTGRTEWGY